MVQGVSDIITARLFLAKKRMAYTGTVVSIYLLIGVSKNAEPSREMTSLFYAGTSNQEKEDRQNETFCCVGGYRLERFILT